MTHRLWVLLISAATWFVSGKVRAAVKAPLPMPPVTAAASALPAAVSLPAPVVPVHTGMICGPAPAVAKPRRPRVQHATTVVAPKPAVFATSSAAVAVPAPVVASPVYGVAPHAPVVVTYHSGYYGYHGGYHGGYWHSVHWR